MLNDNSLGDRLNAVKEGKPVPSPPMESLFPPIPQEHEIRMSFWTFMLNKSIKIVDVFAASFIYGIAIKTVFVLDWSLFGAFTVGFLLNHIITIWPRTIFPKFFR